MTDERARSPCNRAVRLPVSRAIIRIAMVQTKVRMFTQPPYKKQCFLTKQNNSENYEDFYLVSKKQSIGDTKIESRESL